MKFLTKTCSDSLGLRMQFSFLVLNSSVVEKTVSRFNLEQIFPFYRLKENLLQINFKRKETWPSKLKNPWEMAAISFEKRLLN